jgi:hypothetical protein
MELKIKSRKYPAMEFTTGDDGIYARLIGQSEWRRMLSGGLFCGCGAFGIILDVPDTQEQFEKICRKWHKKRFEE